MTLSSLSSPSNTGADLALRVNAVLTETRAARRFAGVAALLADATLTYTTGGRAVIPGDRIRTEDGHAFDVVAASTAHHIVTTSGGVRLRPLRGTDGSISAAQFGARGDGVADDTAAIQAAIDFAIYHTAAEARCVVRLNPGRYRITDTLHLGYGTPFSSVVLEGAGPAYRGEPKFGGTTIAPTFSDRPAINVQGGRDTVIRGLTLFGLFNAYAQAQGLGSPGSHNTVDDTVGSAWADPALASTFDSRHAPYAGVTVDAYSGPRPATSYPDVAYPAFLGTVSQYGKAFSSGVLLEDVEITGFAVALAVQPCNADGNGDFVEWRKGRIGRCKWGVSVGNSQARNTILDGIDVSGVFAVLTSRTHGAQRGRFSGSVRDLSIWGAVNLLDLGGTDAGPIHFTNPYAESLWRLGTLTSSTGADDAYLFTACKFKFSGQYEGAVNPHRGVPATVLDGGSQTGSITFDGCYFWGFPSVTMFRHQGLVFRGGCVFRPVDGLRVRRYEIFAHNALAGGLVTTNLDNPVEADIRARPFNLDTGVTLGVNVRTRLCGATRRRTCIPWYGDSFAAEAEPSDQVPNRTRFFRQVVGKGSLGACTIAGRTLSMTFPARSDAQFLLHGPLPGDVLIDDQTDTVFFVFSRTGTTVLAQAQNNHRASGELILPFSGTVGNLYWRSSRFYTPQHFLRADTTSGSGTLTNVGRDDGYSAWFDSEIAAGDAVTVRDTQDRWISPGNVLITARDQAAATITLASIAARTETRRLDMLARTGPANEAAP